MPNECKVLALFMDVRFAHNIFHLPACISEVGVANGKCETFSNSGRCSGNDPTLLPEQTPHKRERRKKSLRDHENFSLRVREF